MQLITTTELRTKSKELVKALDEGKSVDLIHRSKIIGVFKPIKESEVAFKDLTELENFVAKNKPSKTISKTKRDETRRKNMQAKYG